MLDLDKTFIYVQREWNGWHTAEVTLADLEGVHWSRPYGAPIKLIHAYVSCAAIRAGEIPHECGRTRGPHRLLVCVIKHHVTPSAYGELVRRADAYQPVAVTTPAVRISA